MKNKEIQTGLPKGSFIQGDKHPTESGCVFIQYTKKDGEYVEKWGTAEAFERLKEKKKVYYKKSRPISERRDKERYSRKRSEILKKKKIYHEENAEAICRKKRKYYKDNKDKINAKNNEYVKSRKTRGLRVQRYYF